MNTNLEYTVMLWFKPTDSVAWASKYQYAFVFTNSLACYFAGTTSNLFCESSQKINKLTADTTSIGTGEWTHLTIAGQSASGSYLLLEQNQGIVSQDKSSYIALKQTESTFQVCLGGCDNDFGFIGGMREFVFLNKYYTTDFTTLAKNKYLFWDSNLVAYYRFSDKDFLKDEVKNNYAKITYDSTSSKNVSAIDYIPNDICYPIYDALLFLNFSTSISSQYIQALGIDGRWNPKEKGWGFTMSMWVKINSNTCYTSSPSTAESSCYLAKLNDAFMVFQNSPTQVSLYFFNSKPFYEYQSRSVNVIQNQWINIQFTADQSSGYSIRIYDLNGRLMSYADESRDLRSQNVYKKELGLFKGFNGLSRSVLLFTERKNLPINPSTQSTDQQCLVYFKPIFDGISSNSLLNYCRINSYSSLNAALATSTTQFEGSYFSDLSAYNSGLQYGLAGSNSKLFDGIACNDGSRVIQSQNKNGYIKTQTLRVWNPIKTSTVEFWFKSNQNSTSNSYLTQLFAQQFRKSYFDIMFNVAGSLICSPFGIDEPNAVILTYSDYQHSKSNGWYHVACSFSQSGNVTSMSGLLFDSIKNTDSTYSQVLTYSTQLPIDTYDVYLINNRNMNMGTPYTSVKEFRFWGVSRSSANIRSWRFRQIDPRNFNATQILTYLRLSEGTFREFNFANILNSTVPRTVTISNSLYVQDSQITICPINTYYSSDYGKCYQDPILQINAVIYPEYNNSLLYWVFSSNYSQLVDSSFASQIKTEWQFEDTIMKNAASNISNSSVMKVQANMFRDEAFYKVRLNMTNTDITFNQVQDLVFVPVSCRYFVVNNNNANGVYVNYTTQQSTQDISFTLDYKELQTYCSQISFYNTLIKNITYTVSPLLTNMPVLKFTYGSNNKITVTIPSTEQYKLPTQTDLRFIFTIQWGNSQYNYETTESLVFQNLIYTINFQSQPQQYVQPSLTVNSNGIIFQNTNAVLNASGTYIMYAAEQNKTKGLTYSWTCPTALASLCFGKTSSVLNIPYQVFVTAGGAFNTQYTFQVNILWSNSTNSSNSNNSQNSNNSSNPNNSSNSNNSSNPNNSSNSNNNESDSSTNTTTDTTDTTNSTTNSSSTGRLLADDTVLATYTQTIRVTWYNISQPDFTLNQPSKIRNTYDNLFNIVYSNTTNSFNYGIVWSISPNVSSSNTLPSVNNSTYINVTTGGFSQWTTYTLTVTVYSLIYSQATVSKSINFTVQAPPFGGFVQISPSEGKVSVTSFTFTPQNWLSFNMPAEYRVWSSNSSDGKQLLNQLSTKQYINTSVSVIAENTNPFIVEITDASGEVTYSIVTASLKYKTSVMVSMLYNNMITNLRDKFSLMESIMNDIDQYGEEQIENVKELYAYMVLQIKNDIANIGTNFNQFQSSWSIIVQKSIVILDKIAAKTKYLSQAMISQIKDTLQIIQNLQLKDKLFATYKDLQNKFMNILSNIMAFTKQKLSFLKFGKRMLTDQDSINVEYGELMDINQSVEQMKYNLVTFICSTMTADTSNTQFIETDSFDLSLAKYSTQMTQSVQVFNDTANGTSEVMVQVKDLITQLSLMNSVLDSVCIYTTFYKVNLAPPKISTIVQYSSSLIDFDYISDSSINTQDMIKMEFKIDPFTFNSNQTVCMAYKNSTQTWSDQYCITSLDTANLAVYCQCNMIDTSYVGLFTNYSRTAGQKIQQVTLLPEIIETSASFKFSFLSIAFSMAFFSLIGPLISVYLDQQNTKSLQKPLNQFAVKLLKGVSHMNEETFEESLLKQEDLISYTVPSRSLVYHIMFQNHYFLSIFTKFDAKLSRFTRFTVYLTQLSLTLLLSLLVFGPQYQDVDSVGAGTLYEFDILWILRIGFIGMFVMFPLSTGFMKSEAKVDDKLTAIQLKQSRANRVSFAPDTISDIYTTSPNIKGANDTPDSKYQQVLNQQTSVIIVPRKTVLKYLIATVSYVLCYSSIAALIYYSTIVPQSNQYCIISAFFMAFAGSILIQNTLLVLIQAFLLIQIEYYNRLRFLKFLVSSDSSRIYKEYYIVKQVYQNIIKEEKGGLNRSGQKRSPLKLVNSDAFSRSQTEEDHMPSSQHLQGPNDQINKLNEMENIFMIEFERNGENPVCQNEQNMNEQDLSRISYNHEQATHENQEPDCLIVARANTDTLRSQGLRNSEHEVDEFNTCLNQQII